MEINEEEYAIIRKDDLICPLTLCIYFDPVIAQDGFTYEREAIAAHLNNTADYKSPMNSDLYIEPVLYENIAMRSFVLKLLEHNKSCIDELYIPDEINYQSNTLIKHIFCRIDETKKNKMIEQNPNLVNFLSIDEKIKLFNEGERELLNMTYESTVAFINDINNNFDYVYTNHFNVIENIIVDNFLDKCIKQCYCTFCTTNTDILRPLFNNTISRCDAKNKILLFSNSKYMIKYLDMNNILDIINLMPSFNLVDPKIIEQISVTISTHFDLIEGESNKIIIMKFFVYLSKCDIECLYDILCEIDLNEMLLEINDDFFRKNGIDKFNSTCFDEFFWKKSSVKYEDMFMQNMDLLHNKKLIDSEINIIQTEMINKISLAEYYSDKSADAVSKERALYYIKKLCENEIDVEINQMLIKNIKYLISQINIEDCEYSLSLFRNENLKIIFMTELLNSNKISSIKIIDSIVMSRLYSVTIIDDVYCELFKALKKHPKYILTNQNLTKIYKTIDDPIVLKKLKKINVNLKTNKLTPAHSKQTNFFS